MTDQKANRRPSSQASGTLDDVGSGMRAIDAPVSERELKEALAKLHREYLALSMPIVEALARIEAMKPPTAIYMAMNDALSLGVGGYIMRPDGSSEHVQLDTLRATSAPSQKSEKS